MVVVYFTFLVLLTLMVSTLPTTTSYPITTFLAPRSLGSAILGAGISTIEGAVKDSIDDAITNKIEHPKVAPPSPTKTNATPTATPTPMTEQELLAETPKHRQDREKAKAKEEAKAKKAKEQEEQRVKAQKKKDREWEERKLYYEQKTKENEERHRQWVEREKIRQKAEKEANEDRWRRLGVPKRYLNEEDKAEELEPVFISKQQRLAEFMAWVQLNVFEQAQIGKWNLRDLLAFLGVMNIDRNPLTLPAGTSRS